MINKEKTAKQIRKICADYIIHGLGTSKDVCSSALGTAKLIGGITSVETEKNFGFYLINHTMKFDICFNFQDAKNKQLTPPQKRAKELFNVFQNAICQNI